VHQDRERLAIAATSLLDEVSIHLDLQVPRSMRRGLPTMTGGPAGNVQQGRSGERCAHGGHLRGVDSVP
jgi:hypothetical protein